MLSRPVFFKADLYVSSMRWYVCLQNQPLPSSTFILLKPQAVLMEHPRRQWTTRTGKRLVIWVNVGVGCGEEGSPPELFLIFVIFPSFIKETDNCQYMEFPLIQETWKKGINQLDIVILTRSLAEHTILVF